MEKPGCLLVLNIKILFINATFPDRKKQEE